MLHIRQTANFGIAPVSGQKILNKVIGADAEEIDLLA